VKIGKQEDVLKGKYRENEKNEKNQLLGLVS
jgi:hypothetical protein